MPEVLFANGTGLVWYAPAFGTNPAAFCANLIGARDVIWFGSYDDALAWLLSQ